MTRSNVDSLPDVICPSDVSKVLGVSYAKALSLVKYGGLNYIKIGNTYHVLKKNFTNWLSQNKSIVVKFD